MGQNLSYKISFLSLSLALYAHTQTYTYIDPCRKGSYPTLKLASIWKMMFQAHNWYFMFFPLKMFDGYYFSSAANYYE